VGQRGGHRDRNALVSAARIGVRGATKKDEGEVQMRLALLGGSGRIGSLLLVRLLESGHEVTALARNPDALTAAARLTVVRGDATDAGAVAATVEGADAVLSALGPRGTATQKLLESAASNTVVAMAKTGARRLIAVSAAGAFVESDPDMGAIVKLILPRIFATQFADVRTMEQAVRASDLDWTLVRPSRLVNGPFTGKYRIAPDYAPRGGRKISRADVAHFIATTLEQESWISGAPALAY
jgi:putative NADH-flavin reductase